MRKLYVGILFIFFVLGGAMSALQVGAVSQGIVISQLKPGNATTSRLVEIYNNSVSPVDVTGWCVFYSSPNNTTPFASLGCMADISPAIHIFLPSHAYVLFASSQTNLIADSILTAGLGNGISGHAYVMDADKIEHDRVGWGSITNIATNPETEYITLGTTKVIDRKSTAISGVLQDTDNNKNDFITSNLRTQYQVGALYEVQDLCSNIADIQQIIPPGYTADDMGTCSPPPIDVCTNIEGLQITVPSGFAFDTDGLCQPDVCLNISGLQMSVPNGMDSDSSGYCFNRDFCSNFSGTQLTIPHGFEQNGTTCVLSLPLPLLTELLPNAAGDDSGHEFIEVYNPSDNSIDANFLQLLVGSNLEQTYHFPTGTTLLPRIYAVFYNNDISFTLVNTTSRVSLQTIDKIKISQTDAYDNPADANSWALIDGTWKLTNQPTPTAENLPSVVIKDNTDVTSSGLQPCAPNQYRSLDTNRCRLIVTAGSTLTPCKDGQYRSEVTNRCRSIAADVSLLTTCDTNQYRNPETNRCKLIESSSSTLTACVEGQERNPDTNRCRNSTKSVPAVGFAVEPIPDSESTTVGWWAVGGVCAIALGYGVWEWRQEFLNLIRRIGAFFHSAK
ncbi:hypothetical protein BH10PAT4_BH10PAT4_5120 [soil metagenome]